MSRKRKLELEESIQVVKNVVKSEEDVTYQAFFQKCLTRGLVKPWQEKEIHAFFRDLGLKDKEPSDRYTDALSKY
jgi:hypothetical protein